MSRPAASASRFCSQIVKALCAAALLMYSAHAFAHAILVHSTPEPNATIGGSNVVITLDYNSRIDVGRSTLVLIGSGNRILPLHVEAPHQPAELKATAAHLAPGVYSIHWQVLAADGHITRGEVPFRVK